MIRVYLVEDQTIVREGLRTLIGLAPDIQVIGEAKDGEEAVDCVKTLEIDVMLLDIRMPRLDGIGVLRQLQALKCLPPTLVLTTFDDDELVLRAVESGAKGYLLKDVSLSRLTSAIHALAEGKSIIQPAFTERVACALGRLDRSSPRPESSPLLTQRELEILRLMSGGYGNREIAAAFKLAEGTVKNHVSSILAKLNARDRTRAVLKALEFGYIK